MSESMHPSTPTRLPASANGGSSSPERTPSAELTARGKSLPCFHISVPPGFSLKDAAVSYGFFMLAPNRWIPPVREGTASERMGMLERPLRLADGRAAIARIAQLERKQDASSNSGSLEVRISGVSELSAADIRTLKAQVSRMLRLSEREDVKVRTFQAKHEAARSLGFGRLFRSPSIFEDIIKSVLLCNCGWGRTVSMNAKLCELQASVYGGPLGRESARPSEGALSALSSPPTSSSAPAPRTPPQKLGGISRSAESEVDVTGSSVAETAGVTTKGKEEAGWEANVVGAAVAEATGVPPADVGADVADVAMADVADDTMVNDVAAMSADVAPDVAPSEGVVGAFPTAEELAKLDVGLLRAKCGLGYRAARLVRLAQDVCCGRISLRAFEDFEARGEGAEELMAEALKLPGLGPYSAANLLCCLGEFSTVAADSETARHLREVHLLRDCTPANVGRHVAQVYEKYAPYQFLAYWFELWTAYEKRFGDLSMMPSSQYSMLTGHNMRKHKDVEVGIAKTGNSQRRVVSNGQASQSTVEDVAVALRRTRRNRAPESSKNDFLTVDTARYVRRRMGGKLQHETGINSK